MKQVLLTSILVAIAFVAGYKVHATISSKPSTKGRVTSLGGIFFKCKNPKEIREWYRKNLGLTTNEYGNVFEWRHGNDSTQKGFTQWSPFSEKTSYFQPSTKEFMINYRVENLASLLMELKTNQVRILDTVESYDYGKFVHIMDPEGNKIELWEPNDLEYEKMGLQFGAQTTK